MKKTRSSPVTKKAWFAQPILRLKKRETNSPSGVIMRVVSTIILFVLISVKTNNISTHTTNIIRINLV